MTIISLVYAQSRNGVIGHDGGLPWNLPSDLKRFKETTFGKPVIMGRKTWDGLPRKPLPGRMNIVMTRHRNFAAEGATVVQNVEQALKQAGDVAEVCVIGGGEIFAVFLGLANRIYLTTINVDIAGDTPAPVLDARLWKEVVRLPPFRGEKDSASFVTQMLERVEQP